jgi:hypothetical protein
MPFSLLPRKKAEDASLKSCKNFWYQSRLSTLQRRKVCTFAFSFSASLTKFPENPKGKSMDVNMEELVGNTDGFADSG